MKEEASISSKRSFLWSVTAGLFLLICIAYSNHFTNDFEFDDFHTIVNNEYIRDIKNLPLFFMDIKYFGTNPGNQGYRPVLVSFNAFDYWLAGKLDVRYFHANIFLFYLVQLILMYFLFLKIMDRALPSEKNRFYSLLFTGFYGVHAANAETINYIIQRADAFSTLCIAASFLLYMIPQTRKYYLYLITTVIGLGTKETGAIFGIILFFYILLFEEKVSLAELVTLKRIKASFSAILKSLPAVLFSFALFFLMQKTFFNAVPDSGPGPSGEMKWNGFMTQWVIVFHYIGNFILPLDLSADPDFQIRSTLFDREVLLCLFVILALIAIAFVTSVSEKHRPISFGIIWFFLALAPTIYSSSMDPSGQIANDHRTFFPYIGLVLSLGWWLRLLYLRYVETPTLKGATPSALDLRSQPAVAFRAGAAVLVVYCIVISLHAYGTYQRNIVWSSSATLWHDATIKSPKNGRAQMNYGLSLMAAGKYDETLPYFQRTLELLPRWAFIHINMGILREAMGFSEEAEQYFRNAIAYQPNVPDSYYYYAQWLQKKGRTAEAISQLQEGIRISPGHAGISQYLAELSASSSETIGDKIQREANAVAANPTADGYINLSLTYYRNGMFPECIKACEKALELNPRSALAYNNMCSAYNSIGEWAKGAAACRKALEVDPGFDRAKNNLKWAEDNLRK